MCQPAVAPAVPDVVNDESKSGVFSDLANDGGNNVDCDRFDLGSVDCLSEIVLGLEIGGLVGEGTLATVAEEETEATCGGANSLII